MFRTESLEVNIANYSLTGIMENGCGISFLYPFLDERLSLNDINLYCVLTSFQDLAGNDSIFPSIEKICELMKTNKNTVLSSRAHLRELGYIDHSLIENPRRIRNSFKINEYFLNLIPSGFQDVSGYADPYELVTNKLNNYHDIRDYTFGLLPKKVVFDTSLTAKAKVLFYLFCAKMGTSSTCWISKEYIYHLFKVGEGGVSKRSLKLYMDALAKSGYMRFSSEYQIVDNRKVKGFEAVLLADVDRSDKIKRVYIKSVSSSVKADGIRVFKKNDNNSTTQIIVDNFKDELSTDIDIDKRCKNNTTQNGSNELPLSKNGTLSTTQNSTTQNDTTIKEDDNIIPFFMDESTNPVRKLTDEELLINSFSVDRELLDVWGVFSSLRWNELLIYDQEKKDQADRLIRKITLRAYLMILSLKEEGIDDLRHKKDLVRNIADRMLKKEEKIISEGKYIDTCLLSEIYPAEKVRDIIKARQHAG